MAAGEHCGRLRAWHVDPLTYVTPVEFVDDPEVVDRLGHLSITPEISRIVSVASTWCDTYTATRLAIHCHVEDRRMCPDADGRLVWIPEHGPLVSLESLTFGLTVYTNPAVTVIDERSVIINLRTITAAWTGSLQFGVPIKTMDTTWRYVAGYSTLPSEIRRAAVLYGIFVLDPNTELVIEAQRLLDPYRWTS